MALIAVTSAKGSPGASTAALAFTLAWRSRTILAECDPAGGDILSGFLASLSMPSDRGLMQLALAETRSRLAEEFWGQLIDLDAPQRRRLVLPGIASAGQARALGSIWPPLAAVFAGLERSTERYDVIADCGRLAASHTPWPVFRRADLILVSLRPSSLRTVAPVWPTLGELRRYLIEADASIHSIGLMLIGGGDYKRHEIEHRLQAPVLVQLPDDPRTAAALCGTGRLRRTGDLLRHAASAEERVQDAIAKLRHHQQPRSAAEKEVAGVQRFGV